MAKPKIYAVNQGGHDLSPALRYGEPIIYMTTGQQNRYGVAGMYRQFVAVLEDSQPDDYLLLTGLTNMNVIAAACLAYKHGRLNLLLYKDGRYISRNLVLSELLEKETK